MTQKLFIHNETLIITDPKCILTRADREKYYPTYRGNSDWDYIFKEIGIERYIYTGVDEDYAYWNVRSKGRKIGEFETPDCLVAVFPLNEVLKYNPDFDFERWHNCNWITAIPNFQGAVYFKYFTSGKNRNVEPRVIGEGETPFYSELQYKNGKIVSHHNRWA